MTLEVARGLLSVIAPTVAAPQFPTTWRAFCSDALKLDLSPVMAAYMAAAEGLPVDTIDDATSLRIFGCARADLPRRPMRVLGIRAGGRGGKTSRLAATLALYCVVSVQLPTLRRGEFARALCVAPDKDLAKQIIDYCRGYIAGSPALVSMLTTAPPLEDDEVDESKIGAIERIALRRPSGELVEIAVKAAGRGGTGGRSRTLVCAILDEALLFRAESTAVINDREIYNAAVMRVVPGGRVLVGSTAQLENVGLLEEKIAENWGTHGKALVAIATTRDLNPTWDPTHEIEDEMREHDAQNADREICAIPLTAGAETFYPEDAIRRSFVRAAVELPPTSDPHVAGVDMGFRKNSSALAIPRAVGGKIELAFRLEMIPERASSLRPSVVVREFAFWCMRYGVRVMFGDGHYADTSHEELAKLARALADPSKGDEDQRAWVARVKADAHARLAAVPRYQEWPRAGFTVSENNLDAHTTMRTRMQEGVVILPADERMKRQARDTRKRASSGGHVSIVLPKHGLAHGDLWGATVIGCTELPLVVHKVGGAEAAGGDDWQGPAPQLETGAGASAGYGIPEVSEWT